MQLNFARSRRARTFDHIVGQELSVRVLKNSLYRDYFFPLYLFSGQRGCGKTSLARIFAAAINCKQLGDFQKKPTQQLVPCLDCVSCQAMAQNSHPDFIEIDAASHTGVDNVRAIIDAASLLPVLGTKRIYLIDEAHMLSKSAFNAFLKILEEPPASVLFMLATTDVHKIIDTIISRSFRLLLRPITVEQLASYIGQVCTQENIVYDQEGLLLIAQEACGSIRDALNLLEMIHLADMPINATSVRSVLMHLDTEIVMQLLEYMLCADYQAICVLLAQYDLARYNIEALWRSLMAMVHDLLYLSYGVSRIVSERLQQMAQKTDKQRVAVLLHHLYDYELMLQKSDIPHQVFEMIINKFCIQLQDPLNYKKSAQQESAARTSVQSMKNNDLVLKKKETVVQSSNTQTISSSEGLQEQWNTFLAYVEQLNDPLVSSIFKQMYSVKHDMQQSPPCCTLIFLKKFIFFQELLDSTKTVWLPLLQKAYGVPLQVQIIFHDDEGSTAGSFAEPGVRIQEPLAVREVPTINYTAQRKVALPSSQIKKYRIADVSDTAKWQQTHMILEYFPGTIYLA